MHDVNTRVKNPAVPTLERGVCQSKIHMCWGCHPDRDRMRDLKTPWAMDERGQILPICTSERGRVNEICISVGGKKTPCLLLKGKNAGLIACFERQQLDNGCLRKEETPFMMHE